MKVFECMVRDDFEEVVFCADEVSGLRGILAIHDTTLGPAMGGLRVLSYKSEEAALEDVLRLSRAMTMKASAAGLNLGGGGGVIIADPRSGKNEALLRAFGRRLQGLGGRLYLAEDAGTNVDDMETLSQETGFVAGLGKSRGGSGNPALKGAFGVLRGMQACLKTAFGDHNLRDRRVAIQGVGAVGHELARLLTDEGARVFAADVDPVRVEKVSKLAGVEIVSPDNILQSDCDIFAPCAMGGILTSVSIGHLKARIIAGCANNQLADESVGELLFAKNILYAPDFLINAGGLINAAEELTGYDEASVNLKIGKLFGRIESVIEVSKTRRIPTHVAARALAVERIKILREVRRTWLPRGRG
ncbi:MAG: Glu/Leu/Phe/Val dehydrogenase dimerization domain-containing protein [Candidatus Ozemobacteraceae bacterium]